MAQGMMGIPDSCRKFLPAAPGKAILVIGGSDTGKTTFVEALARHYAGEGVGLIDADVGQSHLGPPTTVGWAALKNEFLGWEKTKLSGFYFVGSTSPSGNLLPCLAGIALAKEELRGAHTIVADTSGFIEGPAARALFWHTIDLFRPDIVIGFERAGELEPLVRPLRSMKSPEVCLLPVPKEVVAKSPDDRRAYRVKSFEEYFREARLLVLYPEGVSFRDIRGLPFEPREEESASPRCEPGTLVSLRDESGRDLALGVAERISQSEIGILTPIAKSARIASVIVGRMRLGIGANWTEYHL